MGIRAFRRAALVDSHVREKEENNIDPDDGNCWLCSACKLPIFSTPFKSYTNDGKVSFLHDQCANLPKELKGSVLHPGQPLFLQDNLPPKQTNSSTTHYCVNCKAICGSMFYYCPDPGCDFHLDVSCSLTTSIKILHRSHEHRLMAIRSGSASYTCGACGTRHDQAPMSDLLYMCSACCFWIHPYCASLPNIIILQQRHHHPLVLNYRLSESFDSDSLRQDQDLCFCAICQRLIQSLGVYSCTKCHYYVHIMCAVSDPHSFKPVLIREARLPDLVCLPIPDEHTSVIRYITDNASTSDTSNSSSDHHDDELHEHPLIFHDEHDDNDDDHPSHICNACIQSISPPFYSCSDCPDFFLHNCCAHLPRTLTQHPAHKQHPLSLFPKAATKSFISKFFCKFCKHQCNGFSYSCTTCNFNLDVSCALMPAAITHAAHGKTHILYSSVIFKVQTELCHCCGKILRGVCYECRTCRNFTIHARCALLPNTVSHGFDQHPLKLTTATSKWSESSQEMQRVCEICERGIRDKRWYYSCSECNQSFHTDCIPCLDLLSKIKFGVTINVQCHDCPLALIQGITVYGYRCGYCRETFSAYHGLVFECSKCYFRIHEDCAEKCLVKDVD